LLIFSTVILLTSRANVKLRKVVQNDQNFVKIKSFISSYYENIENLTKWQKCQLMCVTKLLLLWCIQWRCCCLRNPIQWARLCKRRRRPSCFQCFKLVFFVTVTLSK